MRDSCGIELSRLCGLLLLSFAQIQIWSNYPLVRDQSGIELLTRLARQTFQDVGVMSLGYEVSDILFREIRTAYFTEYVEITIIILASRHLLA